MTKLKINSRDYFKFVVESATREAIKEYMMLKEYSSHTSEFKARVEGIWYELVLHWCLSKYAQLYDTSNQNRNHWAAELKGFIGYLKKGKLKSGGKKTPILNKVIVDYYGVGNPTENFDNIVADMKEDGFRDEERIRNVCVIISNQIQDVFELIDNPNERIDDYINSEFFS
jgi:hypothetical protein